MKPFLKNIRRVGVLLLINNKITEIAKLPVFLNIFSGSPSGFVVFFRLKFFFSVFFMEIEAKKVFFFVWQTNKYSEQVLFYFCPFFVLGGKITSLEMSDL